MKYENKKNGRIAELIQESDKFKTVLLVYEDDKSETQISSSTLKRWWKAIPEEKKTEENKTETVVEPQDENGNNVSETDSEPAKETPKKEKKVSSSKTVNSDKKSKKPVKSKGSKKASEMDPAIKNGVDYVYGLVNEFGDEIFVPAKDIKMRSFKVGGHMYVKFNYSNTSFTIAVKGLALPKKFKAPDKEVVHAFNYVYSFREELKDSDKKLIQDLLTNARNYRITKNNVVKEEK